MIKRISILCLKILTSVTLLMVVFEDVQFNVVFDEFNNMSLRIVSLIFSLMFLQLLIASVRWLKILDYLNISLSYKKCAAYTWAGMFFSQALPSSIGGDAYKTFQIKTLGYSYKGAFCSVVSDRLFGLIGVLTLILIFPFAALAMGHQKILGFDIKFLLYGAVACMLLYFFFLKTLKNFQNSNHFREVYQLFGRLLLFKAPVKTLCLIVTSSFLIHSITILIFFAIVHSFSIGIPLVLYIILIPTMILVTTLPISVAGWGVREGFFVYTFGQFGVDNATSISISIIYGLLVLIFSIPGSATWLLKNKF